MSVFETLSAIDVGQFTEKKGNFTYLSWADAVNVLLKHYPDATWRVLTNPDGYPYTPCPAGAFVTVELTIDGIPRTQVHPVLDFRNKAISEPNAFDVNTAIQRCLAKAISLHGLGLYIYRGEDLPDYAPKDKIDTKPVDMEKVQDAFESWKAIIDADVDVMDYQKLQDEYARLSNDERRGVANMFGSMKPEGSKKGYKAIVKELLAMSPADLDNPDDKIMDL